MKFRLLETWAGEPAWNMAVDEAILERLSPGDPPVLRLYSWEPEALSLGRFQPLSEVASVPDRVRRVRRITGGGALHHRSDEVTYSIVAAYASLGQMRAGPKAAYRAVHDAIALGLERVLGLSLARTVDADEGDSGKCAPLCYDRATSFDLRALASRKLVGSAQRRRGEAFLQHGAVPVSRDPFSTGAVSLEELLGRVPSRDEVARALREGIAAGLGAELDLSALRPDELDRARELEQQRYAAASWTNDRP